MNALRNVSLLGCAFCLFLIGTAYSQSDPAAGIQPFSTQVGGPYDSIDLATSNIALNIPLRSKIGKIPFNYNLAGNSHMGWVWVNQTRELLVGGTSLLGAPFAADLGVNIVYTENNNSGNCGDGNVNAQIDITAVVDATGAAHGMLPNTLGLIVDSCLGTTHGSAVTDDGSGYTVTVQGYQSQGAGEFTVYVYDKSGNQWSWQNFGVTDPDGTTINQGLGSNGGVQITDTLGAAAMTYLETKGSQGDTYTYAGGDGQNHTITTSYGTAFHWKTVFGCGATDIDSNPVYFPTQVSTPLGNFNITYEV